MLGWVGWHLKMAVNENGFFRDIIIPKLSLAQRGRYALRGSARQLEDDVRTHRLLKERSTILLSLILSPNPDPNPTLTLTLAMVAAVQQTRCVHICIQTCFTETDILSNTEKMDAKNLLPSAVKGFLCTESKDGTIRKHHEELVRPRSINNE